MASLFTYSTTYASKITLRIVQGHGSATNNANRLMLFLVPSRALVNTTAYSLKELLSHKYSPVFLGNELTNMGKVTISRYQRSKFGVTGQLSWDNRTPSAAGQMSMDNSAAPTSLWYWNLYAYHIDDQTGNFDIDIAVTIDYYVKFYG